MEMNSLQPRSRPNGLIMWPVALLFFCCLSLSSAQAQNHTEILKIPFWDLRLPTNESKFYRLDLSDPPKDHHLLLYYSSKYWNTDSTEVPELFMSSTKEFPQNATDSDYPPISPSGNFLFINNKDFKDRLYLGLICKSRYCRTALSVEWIKGIEVIANGEKTIENPEKWDNFAVVQITVPKEDDAERIVINFDALNTPEQKPYMDDFLIGKGLAIPYLNKVDRIFRGTSYFQGRTVVIEKDSNLFCTDCVLLLKLKYGQTFSMSIQAETFKKVTRLSGVIMLDGVQSNKENSYIFTGKSSPKEEDFLLSVNVHQGRVTVYINCDKEPLSSAGYKWSHEVGDSAEINLLRSECSTENYFFIVSGQESSVYSLQVTYKQSNKLLLRVPGNALSRAGELSPQEKVTFEIPVRVFSAEEILLDLRFSQSPDLDVSNCRFPTDCLGLLPSGHRGQIANYNGYDGFEKFKYSREEIPSQGLRVKITPKESDCYPIIIQDQPSLNQALPVCAYLVTLSNPQSSAITYSLTAEYKGPNLLQIGESKVEMLTKGDDMNYVVYSNWENMKSLKVQLTEFSGDTDISFSKIRQAVKRPGESDIVFSHEGMSIIEGLADPSGAYYIRIRAQETSYFSLSALVDTKLPQPDHRGYTPYLAPALIEDSAFPLIAGRPQKGVLLPKNQYEAQFYKIFLNQTEDWKGTLRITINSLRGRVLILANNNGELPTMQKNMWNDKDNELEILSNDTKFKAKGAYYITIIIDRSAPNADLLSDLVYHVTYTLIDDLPNPIHTFLSPNTPFYGAKKKGEPHYFETILLADQAPLTIYKSSETGEIDIYVSTDPNNKYPSADSYTETTKADSITVKSCENPEANLCSVYIAIISSKGIHQEVSYSLSMRFEFGTQGSSLPIALEDGRRIQSVAPKNSNSPAVFYYHAVPSQNSVVTVSSPGREVLGIYAKRIKVDIKSLKEPEIKLLKEADADFKSQGTDSFITVPPLENSAVTIVAVSVYFKDTEKESDTIFAILASTQIAPLPIGTPYTGFVIKDHYVYFTLNVTESRSTLLVSLTNIEGDADIVIGYGNSSRPTTTNNKFALLSDKKTEVIEINKDDLSSSESMSGIWVIGVYGDTTSSYILTVVYEEMKTVDLKPNTPVEISLEKSSFVYLKYVHELEKNIEIKFAQISGQVNLYMTYFDLNQDFVANIPNKERNKFVFSEANRNMLIPIQSPQACVSCVYIMNVEAVSSSKFSFVVNELDDILVIENGLEYERRLGAQKSAAYSFKYSKKTPELQMNVEMKGQGLIVFGSESSVIDHSNYLWDETLSAKDSYQIIPLEKPAHKDSYYIIFENPTEKDLDYRFSINLKTVEVGKSQKQYSLDPNEKKLFEVIYDLPPSMTVINIETGERNSYTPAFIDVVFYAAQKKGEKSQQKSMFSYLKEGQTYQIQPFPRGFSGLSDPVFSAREVPEVRSNASHAIVRQVFSGGFPEGRTRFQLEISNPWKFKVSFRLDIGTEAMSIYDFEKTAQYEGDDRSSVSFYDKQKGKWYLWAYTCSLARDLNVEDGDPETGIVTIPKGGSYLYKEEVDEGEKIVSMLPHEQSGDQGGKFYLYSSIFDEKKFKSFDVKKDNLEVELSQQRYPESQDGGRSRVTAKFKPVEFKDAESGDEVIYQVQLCNRRSSSFQENDFCPPSWGCLTSEEVRFPAKQSKHVTVDVKDIEDGKYSAKIKATFVHKSQPVKFAHPYQLSFIDVNYRVGDPVKPKPWGLIAIFTGIAVLLAAVGFIALKKLRTLKESKGLELQKLEISSRGYNPLDEDGVTNEESKNEESKNEEKESPV